MSAFADHSRTVLFVEGPDAEHFLQNLLTQDVSQLRAAAIQFAALLSPQGKILHDMFLVADGARILIDTPTRYQETLRKRLTLYKLRSQVTIGVADMPVYYTLDTGLRDPRHPALPCRVYGTAPAAPLPPETVAAQALALGIPDSARDFEPDSVVALDAGYDLLHGVSFSKGCYVGQEICARMHYKQIARRGFYVLTREGMPQALALLKFDEVDAAQGVVEVNGTSYRAYLPEWWAPKRQAGDTAPL